MGAFAVIFGYYGICVICVWFDVFAVALWLVCLIYGSSQFRFWINLHLLLVYVHRFLFSDIWLYHLGLLFGVCCRGVGFGVSCSFT